jgi:hypothetical protein
MLECNGNSFQGGREMNSHLVDEVVLLEDVEHDRPDDGHLQDPHEDLHQEPGDPRS